MAWVDCDVGRGAGLAGDGGPVGVEPDQGGRGRRQRGGEGRLRHQHFDAGVVEHEGEPLARIVRIERQVGAPGLEDAKEAYDHLRRTLDAQTNHGLRSHPQCAQMVGEAVGVGVEGCVCERAGAEHHRGGVRGALRLLGEQLGQGGRADRMLGVVPHAQDGVALGLVQHRQRAEPQRAVGGRSIQQADQPLSEGLDGRRVEQVGCVFQHALDAARTAVGCAPLGQRQRQVELGAAGGDRERRRGQAGQLDAAGRGASLGLERQHHLEQRMPRQRPRRVQRLNQPLERQVLMRVGRKIARAHPPDQLPECGLPAEIGAQHQRVDEEANELVQRRIAAPGNRAADRNVGARAEPAQQ